MNLAIFGATGATGRCLVEQALEQGHHVTACARNPAAVSIQHAQLSVVSGDVFQPTDVAHAVAHQEAILWTIGGHDRLRMALSGHPRVPGLCTLGTQNVLAAMEQHGVSRLICLSAWGVGDSKGRVPVLFRKLLFPLLVQEEYAEKEAQEQLIRQSSFDWTIVRPSRLTNGPRTGRYRLQPSLEFALSAHISRADVADCLLRQLTELTFRRTIVEISS